MYICVGDLYVTYIYMYTWVVLPEGPIASEWRRAMASAGYCRAPFVHERPAAAGQQSSSSSRQQQLFLAHRHLLCIHDETSTLFSVGCKHRQPPLSVIDAFMPMYLTRTKVHRIYDVFDKYIYIYPVYIGPHNTKQGELRAIFKHALFIWTLVSLSLQTFMMYSQTYHVKHRYGTQLFQAYDLRRSHLSSAILYICLQMYNV